MAMTIDDIGAVALLHDGVKRKGTEARPAWYVDDRLVARWADSTSVVIRSAIGARERLLIRSPETFSVPPRFESHQMVVVELGGADPDAVAEAIAAAVRLQRKR